MRKAHPLLFLSAVVCLALVSPAIADLTFNYDFTVGTNVPDGSGSLTNIQTLGGLSSFTNVAVRLNLSSASGDTMYLGDMYGVLTMGTPSEAQRTTILLDRPGRDDTNGFGSSLSSLNVTLDDSASHTNIWATTSSTGTYNSDGRSGVNPYAAGVAFGSQPRDATLSQLNGSALASNRFAITIADTSAGAQARFDGWGASITGTAASSGTVDPGANGTLSINDGGSGTNTLGASIVTTQSGGGALNVTIGGTTTFSGQVSGTSGLTKLGAGTLILSNASNNNNYSGATIVNAGKLLVNTDQSGATGAVSVSNSGSVLGGTGTIGGDVTVNGSAKVQGGDGTTGTTLTLGGALTLNDNSIIQLALGASGAHSTLARTGSGTWTFDSNQAFTFIDLGATTGTYDNIITGLASDPGTEGSWTITNSFFVGTFTYDGANIDLNLTAVPEPSTWVAGILAAGAIAWTQRKRVSHRVLRGV